MNKIEYSCKKLEKVDKSWRINILWLWGKYSIESMYLELDCCLSVIDSPEVITKQHPFTSAVL